MTTTTGQTQVRQNYADTLVSQWRNIPDVRSKVTPEIIGQLVGQGYTQAEIDAALDAVHPVVWAPTFDPKTANTAELQNKLWSPDTDRVTRKLCAIALGTRAEPLHASIMPGTPSRGPDCVTLINAPNGAPQTKDWTKLDAKGKPQPAAFADKWRFSEAKLTGLPDVLALVEVAALNPFNAITRGALVEGLDPTGWHDRISDPNTDAKNPDGSRKSVTVVDKPNHLLCAEIDVAVSDPLEYQSQLPDWLGGVAHVVQLSSSAGHASAGGLMKAHLWFWLDRPINSVEARVLLKGAICDTKPVQPVGIHFIAAPITCGPDPFEGKRVWLEDGSRVGQQWPQVVAVPDAPAPASVAVTGPLGAAPVAGSTFVHSDGCTYYTNEHVASLKPSSPVMRSWVTDAALSYIDEQLSIKNPTSTVQVRDTATLALITKNVDETWANHCRDIGLAVGPVVQWGLLDYTDATMSRVIALCAKFGLDPQAALADGHDAASWVGLLCEHVANVYGYPSGQNGQAKRSASRGASVLHTRTDNKALDYIAKNCAAAAAHDRQAGNGATGVIPTGFGGCGADAADDDTAEPEPLDLRPAPVPDFEPDWLPEVFRRWLKDTAHWMQVPFDFVAVALLVVVSTAIGARVAIRPRRGDYEWTETANLYGMIVGPPSVLKTPALSAVMKPLRAMDKAFADKHACEMDAFKKQCEVHKHKIDAIKGAMKSQASKSGGESDTTALSATMSQEPKEPVWQRLVLGKVTNTRTAKTLRDNPNGTLLFRDELPKFFDELDAKTEEAAAMRGLVLTAFNGREPYTYDSETQKTIFVPNACLSVLGGAQPGPLQQLIAAAVNDSIKNDGLLQRFSVVAYPSAPRIFEEPSEPRDPAARDAAYSVIKRLVNLNPMQIGASKGELDGLPWFEHDAEANALFLDWHAKFRNRPKEGVAMQAHLGKFPKLVASLALGYALSDFLAKNPTVGDADVSASLAPPTPATSFVAPLAPFSAPFTPPPTALLSGPFATPAPAPKVTGVGVDAVKSAIRMAGFFERHARKLYGANSDIDTLIAARELGKRILTGHIGKDTTAAGVVKKGWAHLKDKATVERAFDLLSEHNWGAVRMTRKANGGHLSPRFVTSKRVTKASTQILEGLDAKAPDFEKLLNEKTKGLVPDSPELDEMVAAIARGKARAAKSGGDIGARVEADDLDDET